MSIVLALAAGLLFGLVASATGSGFLLQIIQICKPIGAIFINALRMVVIPLVVVTIFSGVASIGSPRRLGRLGGLSLLFFWITTAAGILLGMLFMTTALQLSSPIADGAALEQPATNLPGLSEFLIGLIPANPFEAASRGALLPLIIFTALLAAAAGSLPRAQRQPLITLAESGSAALIKLVHWILWTAPLGVFALASPIAAESGWSTLRGLVVFILAVIFGLAALVAAVYLPLVRLLGGVGPLAFLRASAAPQSIALTTASSAAALPAMMDAAVKDLQLPTTSAGLVLALGASLNRAGSALFQGAAVVFLASVYHVPVPVSGLAEAALATFLVSLTVAPVPSASVITLAPALGAVGIPLSGLALLLGVDRLPDMFRTAANVTGHMAAAVVVERLAGSGGDRPRREEGK